jgi:copper chaperone CopZ
MKIKIDSISVTLLMGLTLAAFPVTAQVAARTPAQSAEPAKQKQATLQMRIAGMTCAACAKGLEASFKNMPGVEKAAVDYKAGQATITFDPAKQNADSLSKLVTRCGYEVKETKVV